MPLLKEEWDFSALPKQEYLAALLWEARRETPDLERIIFETRNLLDGKLSKRRKRIGGKKGAPRSSRSLLNFEFSEAMVASIRATAVFSDFLPYDESPRRGSKSLAEFRKAHHAWLNGHLRFLVSHYHIPWQLLPAQERERLSGIIENLRTCGVIRVADYSHVLWRRRYEKLEPDAPYVFQDRESSTLLLNVDWAFSRKRILSVFNEILDQYAPKGVKVRSRRGRKHRDRLVALERLGMMRLLHHYTLAELRLKLPAAWKLYGGKKWYDERRKVLSEFSSYSHCDVVPVSWPTKGQSSRRQVPSK